jgi:hypothetical protein
MTVTDYRTVEIPKSQIQWIKEEHKRYRYHVTLVHIPSGMRIEQVSERSWAEAKESCLMILKWRLAHWHDYLQSRVRPLPINE